MNQVVDTEATVAAEDKQIGAIGGALMLLPTPLLKPLMGDGR